MANQLRMRGGRGTSLGILSGRLRGGFTASSIPRSRQSISSPLSAANSPLSPTSPSPSLSGGEPLSEGSASLEEVNTISGVYTYLASMSNTLRAVQETMKKMDRKISSVEQQQIKLADSLKELSSLIKSNERTNFSIKGSHLETPLKEQAAKLFCQSLTREPTDADINGAVAGVVGRINMTERHKIQLALKFFKAKLTEYRSEERRKILGHAPYKTSCFMSTPDLGMQMMRQMHVPEDVDEEVYIRHVALFRKFVRLSDDDKSATYQVFRQWLGKDRTISEEEWVTIMEEDESFDYATLGVGREQDNGAMHHYDQTIETEIITGEPSDNESYQD